MDAQFKTVRELFAKPGVQYRVPEYQRGYEWGMKQFEDLWVDLERIGSGVDVHYIGNIILLNGAGTGTRTYSIVDGQQRMVTISILMAAIRDSLELDNEDDTLIDEVLNSHPTNEAIRKLTLYNENQDAEFEKIWNQQTPSTDDYIGEAYSFYRSKLDDFSNEEIIDLKKQNNQQS